MFLLQTLLAKEEKKKKKKKEEEEEKSRNTLLANGRHENDGRPSEQLKRCMVKPHNHIGLWHTQ